MEHPPSRDEAIQKAQLLISGALDPVSIALWAEQLWYPENSQLSEELESRDPHLAAFMGTLSLAGAVNEAGGLLYGPEDFRQWLQEFTLEKSDEAAA